MRENETLNDSTGLTPMTQFSSVGGHGFNHYVTYLAGAESQPIQSDWLRAISYQYYKRDEIDNNTRNNFNYCDPYRPT